MPASYRRDAAANSSRPPGWPQTARAAAGMGIRSAHAFVQRNTIMRTLYGPLTIAAAVSLGSLLASTPAVAAIDWASVPGKEVVLFYPGQASWEWALTPADMSGATKFIKEGKSCRSCHDGEEKDMGAHVVSGLKRKDDLPPIEPAPIPGKPGSLPVTVKFANDGTSLFVHLDFKDTGQPDARQDVAVATKVTVMLSAAKTADVVRGGCFAACHDDMAGMAAGAGAKRTHYLGATHAKLTRQGGGDTLKPAADLAKLRADGYSFEDWEVRLNPGQPPQTVTYDVFDKRAQISLPVTAEASYAGGGWSVTLSSPLAPGGELIAFQPGKTYVIGFAIHAGHTGGRYHYVSNERTLAIGQGDADFVAVKK